MSDFDDNFEDNNPFAGSDVASSDRRESISSHDSDESAKVQAADNDGDSPQAARQATRTYSSRVEQILTENPQISISEAGKSKEGNSRGFIAYTIRVGDLTVRRRYSEFESLRTVLTRLFPTVIVPPIPEKHTMSDYAAAPTKAKEDSTIIEHRQRMLAVFLNRCCDIPRIRQHPVFHRFLDPNSSWQEVLNTPPVSDLPKNILKGPPLDPSSATMAHSYLPTPSSNSSKLKGLVAEDERFDEAETNAKEYETVISGGLEKVNRRITKRYSDIANDYSELGAKFNAYSLEEQDGLAVAIEKVGQAIDSSYLLTEALVGQLSQSFSEPLGESAQFAGVVRAVLKYRRQKEMQRDMAEEILLDKKTTLENLERSEQEAQRINHYLHRDLGNEPEPSSPSTSAQAAPSSPQHEEQHTESPQTPTRRSEENFPPTHATIERSPQATATAAQSSSSLPSSPSAAKKRGGFKIPGIGKLNHAIHGFMDVDPESTRRSNIGKTREQISQMEEALAAAKQDVVESNHAVKQDLERFDLQKQNDLKRIMNAHINCHIEWAKKNLESWQEAKQEVEKI